MIDFALMRYSKYALTIIFPICLLSACSSEAQSFIPEAQKLPAGTVIEGKFKTVDGDTVKKGKLKIRILGIDAPDRGKDKPMSHFYSIANKQMERITQHNLKCVTTGDYSFDRPVARCDMQGETHTDIAAMMVSSGYAVEWKSFSKGLYTEDEIYAKTRKLGMWAEMDSSWR